MLQPHFRRRHTKRTFSRIAEHLPVPVLLLQDCIAGAIGDGKRSPAQPASRGSNVGSASTSVTSAPSRAAWVAEALRPVHDRREERVAEAFGGSISIGSADPGPGTSVTITLPALDLLAELRMPVKALSATL